MAKQLAVIPPVRQGDKWGSGVYGARRGSRVHKGVDYACAKGSVILAVSPGVVTKIGYPYDPSNEKKGHYRYVQITTDLGAHERYFYISPSVEKGDIIEAGDALGEAQGLLKLYPGITDHIHFEVKFDSGEVVDPEHYLNQ